MRELGVAGDLICARIGELKWLCHFGQALIHSGPLTYSRSQVLSFKIRMYNYIRGSILGTRIKTCRLCVMVSFGGVVFIAFFLFFEFLIAFLIKFSSCRTVESSKGRHSQHRLTNGYFISDQ